MSGFRGQMPFVGREEELARLQAAFESAAAGQGTLALVAGEPGIGKTALCGQLAAYAVEQGGCVLTGHCYEAGSLSLPYLPFVEALSVYMSMRGPAGFVRDLGSDAVELARILPELRPQLPTGIPAGLPLNPQEGQYRLLQAVTNLLNRASTAQPLLIILEDLHDADRGTLTLLTYLAHQLAGNHLLVVGTYRDTEVNRTHPLSGALAELRRILTLDRIYLRGLMLSQVRKMVESILGHAVSPKLAEAVHHSTEGNPLFTQEVSRYLAEEGLLDTTADRQHPLNELPLIATIPVGLREVIGKRLSRLSPECNRLLTVAAVLGREFRFDTLQAVAKVSDEDLAAGLAEAVRITVLDEQAQAGGAHYRFAHAFFRQMLYEELVVPQRLRLHQQVAQTLEKQYAGRLDEHAVELAEHFAQSSDPSELAKGVSYSALAAERALAVYAYADAVGQIERAIEVQKLLDPSDTVRYCDLLLALGEALLPAGEVQRTVEVVAPEALALAEAMGDRHRASRACQQALAGLVRHDHHLGVDTAQYRGWAEAADRYAAPDSLDRVYADLAMISPRYFSDKTQEAWDLLQRALALARVLDNGEALYQIAVRLFDLSWLPEHQEKRRRIAEELFLKRRADVSERTLGRFLADSFIVFLDWGMRTRAEEALSEARVIETRTRDPWIVVLSLMHDTVLAALDGRLEEAVQAGESLRHRSEELGVPGPGALRGFLATLRPLLYLGRGEEALAGQPESSRNAVTEGRSVVFGAEIALCLTHLGRGNETQPLFNRLRQRWNAETGGFDLSAGILTSYLEAAVLVQDRDLAAKLSTCLAGVAALNTEIFATCIARHLGAASALLGDRETAYTYYQQALEIAGQVRFRPEIALTHLQLAELLLEQTNGEAVAAQHAEALHHLNFAIAELRAMHMLPALERAEQLAEFVNAPTAPQQTTAPVYPNGLSAREVEVLRLLASGRSNSAIADELVISRNTVDRHVSHIFAKTDTGNRTEAAGYAHRNGLV